MNSTTTIQEHTTSPSLFQQVAQLGGDITIQDLSENDFHFLISQFPDLRMEQETNGNITIMAPIAGFGGAREGRLYTRVFLWQEKLKKGETFGPNTGFKLPDGSTKSPDCSWISQDKLEKIKVTDEKGFLKVVPDFVIELASESDRISKLKQKMTNTWIANGVQLGWFIDPYKELAFVYRADGTVDKIEGFDNKLSGENVLPAFELSLEEFRLTAGR